MFLAELNELELWGSYIGNAYLEACTKKVLVVAGLSVIGPILLMVKALYETRSGLSCWHDKHFNILKELGFKPSIVDPDFWMLMRLPSMACAMSILLFSTDDLAIAAKPQKTICDILPEKVNLK